MELFLATLFGLLVGSFLNVCIYRIPREMSVANPRRSFCPACNRQLTALENIPLLSWIVLGGKCKTCKTPISGRYPLVEALSAIAAAGSIVQFGPTPTALVIYALTATLIVISFIDLDFQIIPDVINFPGIIIGLGLGAIAQFIKPFDFPVTTSVFDSLMGVVLGMLLPYAVWWLYYICTKKDGLGMGDVKLLGFFGAVLGWQAIFPIIFTGAVLGAIYGITLIFFTKTGRNTEIPFGPWLALGALVFIFTDLPILRLWSFGAYY